MNKIRRHKPGIVNDTSLWRTKEENLENVSFESVKLASGNRGYGSEDADTAKSNDKPSSELRKTAISTTFATSSRSCNSIVHAHHTKKEIPREYRIWETIPGCQKCRNNFIETRVSRCVINMVRHHDQHEREEDGGMHVDIIFPVLKERFQIQRDKEFTNEDSLNCLHLGSFKTRFEICKDEDGGLKFFRAIQDIQVESLFHQD